MWPPKIASNPKSRHKGLQILLYIVSLRWTRATSSDKSRDKYSNQIVTNSDVVTINILYDIFFYSIVSSIVSSYFGYRNKGQVPTV